MRGVGVPAGLARRRKDIWAAVRQQMAALMVIPMTGCALLIDQPPPAGIEPAPAYRVPISRNGLAPDTDWWRTFRSPELSALVEAALVRNHNIGAAVARIDQAEAQLRISQALLLPTGGVNASRTSFRTSAASLDLPDRLPSVHLHHVDITASYQIDFWGRNAVLIRGAEATALASRFNREVVELTVISTTVSTYLQVLLSQDQLRIAQENLKVARRIRDIIKTRLDAGTSTRIDLAQQDYLVAQQEALVPQIRTLVGQNILALAALVGELPEAISVRGGTLSSLTVPAVDPGLPSELILQRPDIRQAEFNLSAASANLASARVALLPSFSMTAQRGYESTILKTLITPQAIIYNVAANATQPIFDMPNLLAQVELQKGIRKELLEVYRQSIISGFTDVERALVAARETARVEQLTRKSLQIATGAYDLSETQLNAGNIDLTTMLNVQRVLFEAQNALATARLSRFQAALALYQALGGGWKREPVPLREAKQDIFDPVPEQTDNRPPEREFETQP